MRFFLPSDSTPKPPPGPPESVPCAIPGRFPPHPDPLPGGERGFASPFRLAFSPPACGRGWGRAPPRGTDRIDRQRKRGAGISSGAPTSPPCEIWPLTRPGSREFFSFRSFFGHFRFFAHPLCRHARTGYALPTPNSRAAVPPRMASVAASPRFDSCTTREGSRSPMENG